jgi:hypothetical protein
VRAVLPMPAVTWLQPPNWAAWVWQPVSLGEFGDPVVGNAGTVDLHVGSKLKPEWWVP